MPRTNRATVGEQNLTDAFAQGLNEGFRLVGYVTVFVKIGARKEQHTVEAHEVPALVGDILAGLRGEHYETGVEFKILADGDVEQASAPSGSTESAGLPEGEDSIEDAEIVE